MGGGGIMEVLPGHYFLDIQYFLQEQVRSVETGVADPKQVF